MHQQPWLTQTNRSLRSHRIIHYCHDLIRRSQTSASNAVTGKIDIRELDKEKL
ncbi:MAG: hypothetical protein RMX68_018790 [Aulosira sp. ZfuVER01]|nr:hypothetical protein [Aulosira sp. ZfuVER01]MDZ8002735.1 hypothetical protein [Aulosira sp. DedVER01a]MDZ8054446.1 hypothetical protein [Aulosira sp. ZfuCHP01]